MLATAPVHFSDQAPTEREALYRRLNNWDEQWVPGSYWFEGCQTSLNAPSNTGWDYCSPEARAAAGSLLLGIGLGGPFSLAAKSAALDDAIAAAREMGFGVQNTIAQTSAIARYDPDFAVGQLARGRNSRASELVDFGTSQGWTRTQTATGPIKFVDENGVVRVTIKSGSPRAPGSNFPHVELRNANGQRIDGFGALVTRTDPLNHTPIGWDLN